MPLTDLQLSVLKILKPFRTEKTFIGGGAALNQKWARVSNDLDIFDDRRHVLPKKVEPELEKLKEVGFSMEIVNKDEWMVEAILRKYGFETKIQWMDEPETSKRFFPAVLDEEFGYRLHQADAAVNTVLCASRRNSAARDAVDLVNIVRNYAPLGPMVWALAAKDVAATPPQMVRDIRRNVFGYSRSSHRARAGDARRCAGRSRSGPRSRRGLMLHLMMPLASLPGSSCVNNDVLHFREPLSLHFPVPKSPGLFDTGGSESRWQVAAGGPATRSPARSISISRS